MHLLISVLGNLTMRSVCPAVVQLFSARWSKCPTTSHSKFIRVISQWKCTTLTIVCNWDTGLKSFYYFFFFKATLICILGYLRAVEQCSFGHHQLLRKPSNSLAAKCSTLFTNGVCCCRWCTGGGPSDLFHWTTLMNLLRVSQYRKGGGRKKPKHWVKGTLCRFFFYVYIQCYFVYLSSNKCVECIFFLPILKCFKSYIVYISVNLLTVFLSLSFPSALLQACYCHPVDQQTWVKPQRKPQLKSHWQLTRLEL